MSNDWIDDPTTSFDEKIVHAASFPEVEVRGPLFVLDARSDSFGSVVIDAPELEISFGSAILRESIVAAKTLTTA